MFYIHQATCISPQSPFPGKETDGAQQYEATGKEYVPAGKDYAPADNKMKVAEPPYPGIPENILRRMAKSVRMGVGTALPLIKGAGSCQPEGIIIGTANGGMEESVKFLKQIIEYDEDMLAPGNFVQSIPNAIASQISLLSKNKHYNTTHVHRGLAFENAAIDAAMLIREHPESSYLVGGVDEIATYHYNLEYLEGSYKKEPVPPQRLYDTDSPGSLAGEGAAMFLVNGIKEKAMAGLQALVTIHSRSEAEVAGQLRHFVDSCLPAGERPDLFLTGENGDHRFVHFYAACEAVVGKDTPVARYKHMSGEYPTAAAFALWVACQLINGQPLPGHMLKRASASAAPYARPTLSEHTAPSGQTAPIYKNILLYNNYKGLQHSYMLLSQVK